MVHISLQCVTQGTIDSQSAQIDIMSLRIASGHALDEQTLIKMLDGNWLFMLRIVLRIA